MHGRTVCRLYTLFEDVFNAQNGLEYGFSFGTQLLASLTRNDSFHDVLEGLPLLEGVNECPNKLVHGDTQLNDKLCNTDNAGNNTKGGAWACPSDLRTVALALVI